MKDHLHRSFDHAKAPSAADVIAGKVPPGTPIMPLTRRGPRGQFQVVVTKNTRHGRTKLHTFELLNGHGPWVASTPLSPKGQEVFDADSPRWRRLGVEIYKPLPADAVLRLDKDRRCEVRGDIFCAILDGCHHGERWSIDVSGVNNVVSQLVPRIKDVIGLDGERRRLAEPALYTQILEALS